MKRELRVAQVHRSQSTRNRQQDGVIRRRFVTFKKKNFFETNSVAESGRDCSIRFDDITVVVSGQLRIE